MMKACSKCGKIKSAEGFFRDKNKRDGLQSQCKICQRQYQRQYQQSERGRWVAQHGNRKYRQTEKGKQAYRKHHQSEKYKQYKRQYNQSEKYKQYQQSERRKQAKRKADNIRRTRKTQAGGSYSTAEWYNLCKFYNFHCLRCNIQFPFDDLTMDHIKPVDGGGSSFIWNAQPLCGLCNSRKNNKEIDYRRTLPDWINRNGPIWMQGSLF